MVRWVNYKGRKCCVCGSKETYIKPNGAKDRQSLPDSQNNLRKSTSNYRTGNVSVYDEKGKGIIGQAVSAKTLKIDDLNIIMDNFIYALDIGKHCEYGYIEVKTSALKKGKWQVRSYQTRNFDNILVLCMDEYELWKNVERVYIIPWAEVIKRSGFAIIRKPSRDVWYYEFRVDAEPFNDNYHSLMYYFNGRKYFGIKDIKKWLTL